MREEALAFSSGGARLHGIVTPAGGDTAVVILNAGLIHRVGPHRLSVALARRAAACGYTALRFDFSGIGDSEARRDRLSQEEARVAEVQAALEVLNVRYGASRFVVTGLCGGAYFAFRSALADERIIAAALLNARGHLHGTNAEAGEELRARALRANYWRLVRGSSFRRRLLGRALRGDIGFSTALGILRGRSPATAPAAVPGPDQLRALAARGVRLLHLYSESDEGLDYAYLILGMRLDLLRAAPQAQLAIVAGANHTFTLAPARAQVVELFSDWLSTLASPSTRKSVCSASVAP